MILENKTILDFFLQDSKWEIKKVYDIIKEDYNKNFSLYFDSKDEQLFDYSYEFNFNKGKIEDNIVRFSYFWTKINFIDKFGFFLKKELILKLKDKYNFYKKYHKEDFVTFSFSFIDGKLKDAKLYFDIFVSKDIKFNKFDKILFKRTQDEVVLLSFTINKKWINEEKIYFPINNFIKKLGSTILKDNILYKEYEKYNPFDILFRFKDWTLSTLKYYYYTKENQQIEKEIEKYFPWIELPKINNIKQELWVDFLLSWWIKRINYYISQYK